MPSGRLTWNNVTAPDFSSANQMFDRAAIMQNNAARMINQAFDDYRKDQSRVADNLVAERMAAIQDLDAYKNALASGEFLQGTNGYVSSQMLNNLQNGVGTRLANAANLESLETAKENRAWNQLERDTLIAASPYLQEINALANAGKYDEASRRIADLQKMAETNGWRYDVFGKYLPDVGAKQIQAQELALRTAASRAALQKTQAEAEAIQFWNMVSMDPERFNAPLMKKKYLNQFNALSGDAKYFLINNTTFSKDFGNWTSQKFGDYSVDQSEKILQDINNDIASNNKLIEEAKQRQKNITKDALFTNQYYQGQIDAKKAITDNFRAKDIQSFEDSPEDFQLSDKTLKSMGEESLLRRDSNRAIQTLEEAYNKETNNIRNLEDKSRFAQTIKNANEEQISAYINETGRRIAAENAELLTPLGISLRTLQSEVDKLPGGARDFHTYARVIAQQHGRGDDQRFISDVSELIRKYTGKNNLSLPEAAAIVSSGIGDQNKVSRYFGTNISADVGDLNFYEPTEAAIKAVKNAPKNIALAEQRETSTAKVKELIAKSIAEKQELDRVVQIYMDNFGLSREEALKRAKDQNDRYNNSRARMVIEAYNVLK